MALYTVDVEKRLNSEFWSNRYIVEAPTLGDAQSVAGSIVGAERGFHMNIVTFTRVRVSTLADTDDSYVIIPINAPGFRLSTGSLLPLFNTLRMDIIAPSGRPSRKYYRGVLTESDINGDAIDEDFTSEASNISALFSDGDSSGIVGPQGEIFTGISVIPFVQMRQLRRSRRRRTNGGGIFQ